MDTTKLKKIKMALMVMEGAPKLDEEKKDNYVMKVSGEFETPEDFYDGLLKEEAESLTSGLVNAMYAELIENIKDEDSLGMWIDYDGKDFENAIKLDTLKDMEKFGADEVDPVYEFFKMTIKKT